MPSEYEDEANINGLVLAALGNEGRVLLQKVATLALEYGMKAYIVGGSVRDFLLNRPHYDLDVAVVGDAVALARELEARGVGKVAATHRFGTAELDWHRPGHLDLVTARREWYEHPGALPSIEPGTIFDDLARRDFTVNAMAVELDAGTAGPLVDPHGGRADIAARTIRILHNRSFIDDPTRILRAAKYAGRLGFSIEPHTVELIFQAVRDGALGTVSLDRSMREVLLAMHEANAKKILADLERYGVLRAIHPDLYWPYPGDSPLVPGPDQRMTPEERRDTMLALMGAEFATEPQFARHFAREVGLDAKLSRLMEDAARLAGIWPRLGEQGLRRSEVDSLLKGLDPAALEAYARIEAMSRDGIAWGNLRSYLGELRQVKSVLGGDYLKGLGLQPGPLYKRLLTDLRTAKLDGKVSTQADEAAFIADWLNRERQEK